MTERRRSLFVLLLVLGLIAASIAVISQRDTKLGLDLQGGVQLVYEGKPTPQQPQVTQEALQRALDIMRERVDALGVAEPELMLGGRDQIEVNLPGEEDIQRAEDQVGNTAQLFFYDWEANILDENCRTDPDENSNLKQAVTGLFRAVQRASKCDPQVDRNNNAAGGPRFYTFDEVSKLTTQRCRVPTSAIRSRTSTSRSATSRSSRSSSPTAGARPSTGSRARSRSVGRTTRCCRPAPIPRRRRSTSRSCSTTS
jgi:preprotein translocase subunit SecD